MSNQMVLRPQTFDQLATFANMAAKSALVPRDYQNRPENIMLAVQMGSELGLAPMQALQNIAVVNGRPALWGDAMLALCKTNPYWGGIQERITGEGDAMAAMCEVHRKGDNPVIATFSVADAKKAGLWQTQARVQKRRKDGAGTYEADNDSPWYKYPKRMLQMRARGFALRDAFPDALKGLVTAEEAADTPVEGFTGTTIEASAEPVPTNRDEINEAVPIVEKTPEERARDWTDATLPQIRAADEDALHAMAGDSEFSKRRDWLSKNYPAMDAEIAAAMKVRLAEVSDFPGDRP